MYSMFSQRGSALRVFQNFKFKKYRVNKKGQIWRCTFNSCCVTFLTDLEGNVILEEPTREHSHVEVENLGRQFLANSVKRKALDDISIRPRKLVRTGIKEARQISEGNLSKLDLNSACRSVYRCRRSKYPAIPTCIKDVHEVLGKMNLVCEGKNLLLVNDEINHIIVFGTDTNLRFLCKRKTILMDGTFKYCTMHFYQLFTIHSVENDHYIPLLFCLLSNKEAATYTILLKHLVRLCDDIDEFFYPETVVVDYEEAIHKALLCTWPLIKINGCRFHLGQAWWRMIQKLGNKLQHNYIILVV